MHTVLTYDTLSAHAHNTDIVCAATRSTPRGLSRSHPLSAYAPTATCPVQKSCVLLMSSTHLAHPIHMRHRTDAAYATTREACGAFAAVSFRTCTREFRFVIVFVFISFLLLFLTLLRLACSRAASKLVVREPHTKP
eukprot:1284510-Rhodomonas_salina.2